MNARSNLLQPTPVAPTTRSAFTLVEILVVIAIIGILSAVLIPAVTNAVRTARVTSLRLEITALEGAVEQYQQKHGDYPPDFSSWAIVERHYRKAFPRMSTNDYELLVNMLHSSGTYDATQLDRGEVLAWTLGGYSDDTQRPFTGPGGPLAWTGDGTDSYEAATDPERQDPTNFQVNIDRPNAMMDFDASQLDYSEVNDGAPMIGANRRMSSDGDLFLSYRSDSEGAPFVYFDSRTYTLYDPNVSSGAGDFNGYGSSTYGYVRPYLSTNANTIRAGSNYNTQAEALGAWQFVNPNTFQIISAGLDNHFGATASYDVDASSPAEPIYFQYDSGAAIALLTGTSYTTPEDLIVTSVSRYQESAFGDIEQYPADNITNFSNGTVVDDVP